MIFYMKNKNPDAIPTILLGIPLIAVILNTVYEMKYGLADTLLLNIGRYFIWMFVLFVIWNYILKRNGHDVTMQPITKIVFWTSVIVIAYDIMMVVLLLFQIDLRYYLPQVHL